MLQLLFTTLELLFTMAGFWREVWGGAHLPWERFAPPLKGHAPPLGKVSNNDRSKWKFDIFWLLNHMVYITSIMCTHANLEGQIYHFIDFDSTVLCRFLHKICFGRWQFWFLQSEVKEEPWCRNRASGYTCTGLYRLVYTVCVFIFFVGIISICNSSMIIQQMWGHTVVIKQCFSRKCQNCM